MLLILLFPKQPLNKNVNSLIKWQNLSERANVLKVKDLQNYAEIISESALMSDTVHFI